jgi:hypothetical protein
MIEKLLSCASLLRVGLMLDYEYIDILDAMFIKTPDNELLLDLEFVSSDINKTISIIQFYCGEHNVDYAIFGRYLIEGLKKAYSCYSTDIEGFAAKVYELWNIIPSSIQSVEPFFTMCYSDDPLSWGDKEQTRRLYEKMFQFYDEK